MKSAHDEIYGILLEIYHDPESMNIQAATEDCIEIARRRPRALKKRNL